MIRKTVENTIETFDYTKDVIYKHLYINSRSDKIVYNVEFVYALWLFPEFENNICRCDLYGNYYFFVTDNKNVRDSFIIKLKEIEGQIIDESIYFVSYQVILNREFLSTTFRKITFEPKKTDKPKYTIQFNVLCYKSLMWKVYNNELT